MNNNQPKQKNEWWKQAIFYQIYSRSFADSNVDGIGDINGITQHLDYLNDGTPASLGVDAIWLTPIYSSPQFDFGYDVSDYLSIDPCYGTMEDFERLIGEAHQRNIKIIMDMVPNHTSCEHAWFKESRSSKDNPKRDWYIWTDGRGFRGRRRPNNWMNMFEGSAWKWDKATRQFYYHAGAKEQPDLNWRNPQVKEAMFNVFRFWLDKGVDGFRLDVINHLVKDDGLRSNPVAIGRRPYEMQRHLYDRDLPETHEIIKDLRKLLDEYPDRMMVGEINTMEPEVVASYYGQGNNELHLGFDFAFALGKWLPYHGWKASIFKKAVSNLEKFLPRPAWPCYFLSNHDACRHFSAYDKRGSGEARARVAAAMLLTLRGSPFLYYGEEIGMPNSKIPRKKILDPPGKRFWPIYKGRDAGRTPMQWNDSKNAGFGSGEPWLPADKSYKKKVNVAAQKNSPDSLLYFYKKLIRLRKSSPALFDGSYYCLENVPGDCFAFLRKSDNQKVLVALNFSSKTLDLGQLVNEPELSGFRGLKLLLFTHTRNEREINLSALKLSPYEVFIAELI